MRARTHGVTQTTTAKIASEALTKIKAPIGDNNLGPIGNLAQAASLSPSFDYMFPDLITDPNNKLPTGPATVAALKALGQSMVSDPSSEDGQIPAAYTYFGQFIDHDITKTAFDPSLGIDERLTSPDPTPLTPSEIKANVINQRTPALDLESVYEGQLSDNEFLKGELPAFGADGEFRIGETSATDFGPIPTATNKHDLPRRAMNNAPSSGKEDERDRQALIGDPRNDENLLVAQLHLALMRSHNSIISSSKQDKLTVQKSMRRRYQWAVLHDFLPRICDRSVLADILENDPKFLKTNKGATTFLPLEFSVAGFRFGHSMIRQRYEHNATFNSNGIPADFNFLFTFTALSGDLQPEDGEDKQFASLPNNWPIEWHRFFGSAANPRSENPARLIDTHLAPELGKLRDGDGNIEGATDPNRALFALLATRNLLRGYLMGLPTGQAVAQKMGAAPLTPAQLESTLSKALTPVEKKQIVDAGFLTRTPLWYYILAEAQLTTKGSPPSNHLGVVGSRIVAETLWTLIKNSPDSVLDKSPSAEELATGEFTLRGLVKLGQDSVMPPIPDFNDVPTVA